MLGPSPSISSSLIIVKLVLQRRQSIVTTLLHTAFQQGQRNKHPLLGLSLLQLLLPEYRSQRTEQSIVLFHDSSKSTYVALLCYSKYSVSGDERYIILPTICVVGGLVRIWDRSKPPLWGPQHHATPHATPCCTMLPSCVGH